MTAEVKKGYLFAILAYVTWGFVPLFWHLLQGISPYLILCHRIAWSMAFYVLVTFFLRRKTVIQTFSSMSQKSKLYLLAGAILVSTNWLVYVYGVTTDQITETSLGYFLNPLFNVLLGKTLLDEKLSPLKWVAVGIATIGVLILTLGADHWPWIALVLAFTFGLYGFMRKSAKVVAIEGSLVETTFLLPGALLFLFSPWSQELSGYPWGDGLQWLWLLIGGVLPAFPLWWFSEAANRIPLSTLGFFQYIAPIIQFILAVLVFHEHVSTIKWVSFGIIWMALIVFCSDIVLAERRKRRLVVKVSTIQ